MARQPAGRLPKRLMDGKLVEGEDPDKRRPEQNWLDCLKDDFQAFGATDGSTVDNRLTFRVNKAVWTLAEKTNDEVPWHTGVLQGAENVMTSWHKEEEEASGRRATKRDSESSTTENTTRPGGGDTQGNKGRKIVQTEDITAVEESKREMAERVARYVPD